MRSAIDEIIRIGREANIPVQISHIKIALLDDWGQASEIIKKLDEARALGVDITADVYPYDFWLSTLAVLLPERNFDDIEAVRTAFAHLAPPEGLTLARYEADPELVGKTVQEIADERGEDPAATYLSLIKQAYAEISLEDSVAASDLRELVLGQSMSKADVEAFYRLAALKHIDRWNIVSGTSKGLWHLSKSDQMDGSRGPSTGAGRDGTQNDKSQCRACRACRPG